MNGDDIIHALISDKCGDDVAAAFRHMSFGEGEGDNRYKQLLMILLLLEFKQVTERGHAIKIVKEIANEDDKVALLLSDIGDSIRGFINFGPIAKLIFGENTLKVDLHF